MNKTCKKCRTDKPVEQFRKNSKTKDGLFLYCKDCQDIMNKELYIKNKQKRISQITKWNIEHPDKLKDYKDTWRKNKKQDTTAS